MYESYLNAIDQYQDEICGLSDYLWANPETAYAEVKGAAELCRILESHGFEVKRGVANIPTAFTASFGSGKPHFGVLAEYDALSGMSQQAGMTEPMSIPGLDEGHGCGHNNIAAGCVGAALGIKAYLEAHPEKGSVVVYGCPGEEGGSGKTFMAREGVFDGCDFALTWHPSSFNAYLSGGSLANYQIQYRFYGQAAHAASAPELGRSALDAVELMNTGVQYLREHMPEKCRIHYAITNAGGFSPNVVQERADVLYLIRSPKSADLEPLYQRVNDIARGAAMMTGTRVEIDFIKACCEQLKSESLEKVLYRNMEQLPLPQYTEEEYALAKAIQATFDPPKNILEIAVKRCGEEYRQELADLLAPNSGINDFLLPNYTSDAVSPWSTDVGDVTWICPTVQLACCTLAAGTTNHSWQEVAMHNTSIAHKGTMFAAQTLTGSAIDLYESKELQEEVIAEHKKRLGGATYKCPIPADVKPRAINQL